MERFYKRKSPCAETPIAIAATPSPPVESPTIANDYQASSSQENLVVDLQNLPSDPGLRPSITSYPLNLIEQVRRTYLLKGPCQPHGFAFPATFDGARDRSFVASWFIDFKPWLEYSVAKDAAFCLYCYLFSTVFSTGGSERGHDTFVTGGFNKWRKKEKLRNHVGRHTSVHNRCRLACQDLLNQAQHIEVSISKVSKQSKIDYRCRLNATVVCVRYLLLQGLAFRGNDESEESNNQGNFVELLKVISSCNEDIKNVVLKNAPENLKLTSPDIQKDVINAAAIETTNAIIEDIGSDFFSILVDECRDISVKEQMGVVIRYVNKGGCVIERFLGLVHVNDTSATTLEKSIYSFFSTCGLSISNLRGQGYDGASNMRGEFNGLKSLILKKNSSAYYVHCFAHQLQLTLVAVAKKHTRAASFFNTVTRLTNVVGGSCKRRDMLREKQREKVVDGIANGNIVTGKGKNQEKALKRPGDTRWSSHYNTLINLIDLFRSVMEVLDYVGSKGSDDSQRAEAIDLLEIMNQFDFVFGLHFLKNILGITHDLSQVLQRKDQDIVNAMKLVNSAKTHLQAMRDNGWEGLLADVSKFCCEHDIVILDMKDVYAPRGRPRRRDDKVKNLHHYRFDLFISVIDMQKTELNSRFDVVNTELLLCMTCLDPRDSFKAFNKEKLLRLARFYPSEFSGVVLYELETQLENFVFDVRLDESFANVGCIGDLSKKMVSTRKHDVFPLVYLLIKLSLILPVATATVERAFSAMKIIKTTLRNRIGDGVLNDCLVTYIEKDIFKNVSDEAIMHRFQIMKNRRGML